jgi:ACS family allantoate permease-like MFS transporter
VRFLFWKCGQGVGFIAVEDNWRRLFWITGMITFIWDSIILAIMPDSPVKAKFLTEHQKDIRVERLREDQIRIEKKTFKMEQMIETFLD